MSDPQNATEAPADAMARLAEMVAGCAEFQEKNHVAEAEEALKFVHYPHLRQEECFDRARVVIKTTRFEYYRVAGGGQTQLMCRGGLEMMLGAELDADGDSRQEEIAHLNYIGAVMRHLKDKSGLSDNLNIVAMRIVEQPARSDPRHVAGQEAQKPYYLATVAVDWDQQ
jgi:hypothetical protein